MIYVACLLLTVLGCALVYQVAKVVADEMNNYLLFEHTLRVSLVPPEKVHPKL